MSISEIETLPVFDFAQVLPPFGFQLPARMSVLSLGDGKLALVSPVPIDDACARELAAMGEVAYLLAPCLFHSMYLADAMRRYPAARVGAPRGLAAKHPNLRIDFALEDGLPDEITREVDVIAFEGAPQMQEFVFYHRATRTLVVTDLVFNLVAPRGWFANLVTTLMGTRGHLAPSRALRFLVKDKAASGASLERMLALPFETLVMAHGEVVREDAHARFAAAMTPFLPRRNALPAST